MKWSWNPHKAVIGKFITTAFMNLFAQCPQCWKELNRQSGLWQTIKQHILERDNWRCIECKTNRGIDVYHVVRISEGGSNLAPNLRTYCRLCQKTKAQGKRNFIFKTNTERTW